VVRGEAGIGKSALLQRARERVPLIFRNAEYDSLGAGSLVVMVNPQHSVVIEYCVP
jgi:hypothetical protein